MRHRQRFSYLKTAKRRPRLEFGIHLLKNLPFRSLSGIPVVVLDRESSWKRRLKRCVPAVVHRHLASLGRDSSHQAVYAVAEVGAKRQRRKKWWARLGSNQLPDGYEPSALPVSYGPGK